MTPKEKAIFLFNEYAKFLPKDSNGIRAKQGAIFCVEQIIYGRMAEDLPTKYWQQVKKEIENL